MAREGGRGVDAHDRVPLSLRDQSGSTLYARSYEASSGWAVSIAKRIRADSRFERLANSVGEECASMLVEKELFHSLVPCGHRYARWKYARERGEQAPPLWAPADDDTALLLRDELAGKFDWAPREKVRTAFLGVARASRDRALARLPIRRIIGAGVSAAVGCEVADAFYGEEVRSQLGWWDPDSLPGSRLLCSVWGDMGSQQFRLLPDVRARGVSVVRDFAPPRGSEWRRLPPLRRPRGRRWSNRGGAPGVSRWLDSRIRSWALLAAWWQRFFETNSLSVWMSVAEFGPDCILQRAAMDRIGGTTTHVQRSFYVGHADSLGHHPAHVLFSWSNHAGNYFRDRRNRNRAIRAVGHPFGAGPGASFPTTATIRRRFADAKLSFVVAVMNNAANPNGEISEQQQEMFFSRLTAWIREHSETGLVVKAKNAGRQSVGLTNAQDLMDNGRLIVVDSMALLPLAVAKAADVTIGINLSSAALEASISGSKTLLYYPGSNKKHPVELAAAERVVFDSLDPLMFALDKLRRGAAGELGLMGDALASVDEFRDGGGPVRIRRSVEALAVGEAERTSLQEAGGASRRRFAKA